MIDHENIGQVRIADDVVATLAGIAAMQTPGVVAMSTGLSENISKQLSGRVNAKGVDVEVGTMETAITLRIIIEYGLNIREVCMQLQENVIGAVSNMTGLNVVEVNVKVEGVAVQ